MSPKPWPVGPPGECPTQVYPWWTPSRQITTLHSCCFQCFSVLLAPTQTQVTPQTQRRLESTRMKIEDTRLKVGQDTSALFPADTVATEVTGRMAATAMMAMAMDIPAAESTVCVLKLSAGVLLWTNCLPEMETMGGYRASSFCFSQSRGTQKSKLMKLETERARCLPFYILWQMRKWNFEILDVHVKFKRRYFCSSGYGRGRGYGGYGGYRDNIYHWCVSPVQCLNGP